MKILVVGGTRYFGIPMVNTLLKKGHEITIATRGNSKPVFDGPVDYVVMDRMDPANISFVRYPIVMGENDYTGRLDFYIEHIRDQKPMNIDDIDTKMAFIYEKDAGDFIAYLAEHFVPGPINGCSKEAVKISDIIEYIEKRLGKKAVISQTGNNAPYNGIEDTLSFSTEKAESIGYRFRELKEWLYPLIDFRTATSN